MPSQYHKIWLALVLIRPATVTVTTPHPHVGAARTAGITLQRGKLSKFDRASTPGCISFLQCDSERSCFAVDVDSQVICSMFHRIEWRETDEKANDMAWLRLSRSPNDRASYRPARSQRMLASNRWRE